MAPSHDRGTLETTVRQPLKNQLRAALAMLGQAVERCPEDRRIDTRYSNAFWHVAYHAHFHADLYLQPRLEDFQPWTKHETSISSWARSPCRLIARHGSNRPTRRPRSWSTTPFAWPWWNRPWTVST